MERKKGRMDGELGWRWLRMIVKKGIEKIGLERNEMEKMILKRVEKGIRLVNSVKKWVEEDCKEIEVLRKKGWGRVREKDLIRKEI